jgi:Ca2+-transporting ATPase
MPEKRENFYSMREDEVIKLLNSSKSGLSNQRASQLIEKYGLNKLSEKKGNQLFKLILNQFKSFFVFILILAATISFIIDHLIDAYVIISVIVINSAIGFFQERKAERAMSALKKMIVNKSKVYRSGELEEIDSSLLVPGDIIQLDEGDKIPADARLIEVKNFKTVEASLTGESLPVYKNLRALPDGITLADRTNMVYLGTFVASGTAKAIIVSTGDNTALGKLASSLNEIKRAPSHFEKSTKSLAMDMGIIAIVASTLTFMIGYFLRGFPLPEMIIFTISSLVSGIPEGLPAVLTIVLAIGATRMSKKNAIVRNLSSIETLAVVNTIITDKTGTITENSMTVKKILLPLEEQIIVTGSGWSPEGNFIQNNRTISPLENQTLTKLLHIAAISNSSKLILDESKNKFKIIGDPTEGALIVLAEKAGLRKEIIEESDEKIDDLPFNAELKYRASLSSLVSGKDDKKQIYVIGAPEEILKFCKYLMAKGRRSLLTEKVKKKILSDVEDSTNNAMRVVAMAYKPTEDSKKEISQTDIKDLIFTGFVAMQDPPRIDVPIAIEKAKEAGIRIIMATGDHKNTAIAIAKQIGMYEKKENYPDALTGSELEELDDKKFLDAVKNINIFARLTPQMKLKIASVLQENGAIIAMTGDGVNDAPALKKADIGISMGIVGTDVARESSQMVLADDNFSTIIKAVEEGRIVFNNTRKTSFFLVTTNLAESLTIITTLTLGMPLPLIPTQILWLNLVTDTGPALGLAAEPGHEGVIKQGPKQKDEQILTKDILPFILIVSLIMILSTIYVFFENLPEGIEKARTSAFVVMALTQVINSLNMRSHNKSVFKIGISNNKYLWAGIILSIALIFVIIYVPFFQNIFQTTQLNISELIVLFMVSMPILGVGELYKYIKYRR